MGGLIIFVKDRRLSALKYNKTPVEDVAKSLKFQKNLLEYIFK